MNQSLQLKPFSGVLDASPEGFKPFSGVLDKVQNKSFAGDTVTDIKRGIEQLPGAITGLADIVNPLTYVTGQRMADTAANWIGDKTGFKPSQWAKDAEAEYSPERKASDQAINRAWDKGGIGDIAGSYLSNPRSVAGVVAQSLPSVVGGGAIARGAMKGIAALSGADMAALSSAAKLEGSAGEAARNTINRMATTAAGIGEGAITAGQNMDQVSRDEDPRTAALTSAAAGAVTGTIGKVSGRVANKLGLPDVETAMAGGGLGAGSMPWYKRIPSSMVQESLLQELPQSAQEQVWQNIAEGKPWHEGVARQAIEGALAGAAMGGGVATIPQSKSQEAPPTALPAPPAQEINGLPQAPAKLPEGGPLSAVVNLGIDSGATTLEPPTTVAPPAPALRERDFVPPPAGSFGQMSEFAGLLDSERADSEARKKALVAGQQLRKDSALESTDARVADARIRESNQQRDALLASVLDNLPEGQNPSRAFGRALREQGYADTFFRPEETARISAWKNISREAPAPDVIPSAPNEMDAAALGIKERQSITPEGQKQRAIEANKKRFEQTRRDHAAKKAALSIQEAQRGDITSQEAHAKVATPSAQAASGELPGSASVLAPAPVGDAGRTGNRAEVAAPGVRPAVSAGTASRQDIGRPQAVPKTVTPAISETVAASASPASAAPKTAMPLSIGRTPKDVEPIAVKNGVVHIGNYPVQDFETGSDVMVPDGATGHQIKDALEKAGAIGKGQKIYGLPQALAIESVPDVVTLSEGRPYVSEAAARQGAKRSGVTETHEVVPAGDVTPNAQGFVLRRNAREKAVVKQEQEAEQRRKADAERADFGLTGSDRQADVGAARGQGDIFSQSATPKETDQKLSKPAEDAKPAIEAPKKAEEPGNAAMFSRPTAPEINPHLVKWATSVLDKARGIAPVMPIMREPSAVLNLAGIYRPIVIDMEHAGHAMNVHPEISPEDIGALPDLLKRPRAILKHKNGWRLLVDSRDGKGNPLSVALTNDLITSGKDRLKVTEVSTMFGKDDSAAYLVKEIESGNVIYMPEKEIGRLLELLSAPQLRTQAEESQPPTNQISDRTFNLLSDESLVNFQKDPKGGWASNTTSITLPANASEILHGEHFSRSGSATGQTVAAVRAEVSAKIGKMKLAILERKGLVRIHADISTMPAAAQKHPDTWGYFDGKTMHLVAGNLEAGQAAGIFQHEAWHAALRSLKLSESPLYQKIMDRLGKIERNGVVAKWFEEGYQMIPREDRQNDAKRLNEMAAYAIQQYENEPKSLPLLIRRFVEDLIASVRAFFMENLGWVPENLTAADLAALTRRYVDEMASGETMVGPMGEAMAARLEDQGKAGSVLGMNEPGASAGSGVKFSKPHNDGLQSDYELPNKPSIHRAIDGADLTALRRAAAGLERTRDSIFLRVSEDGNAIATGPKGTRIPDTFRRFANDHDLAFYAERRVPRAPDAIMGEGSSTSSMDIGITRNSEPMPIVYRESGARYFGEDVGEALDRSDKTRFSRPRFSVSGQQIQQAWKNPDNLGPWDNFVRAMQDKLIDTKRIVEEIRKAGIAIKDELDPYLQEILYHGRAAARVNDFSERELNPMLVEMSMRGIQTPEARQAFEDYLWAQHAPERNAQIAKVNAKMPDGGSGLTNQQAADVMAGQTVNVGGRDVKLDMTKLAAYQSLAKRVAAINKGTTDTLVRYGLETQETVDAWRKTYGHYVPLMRDMEADDNYAGALGLGLGTGQGFSVRGSAAKRAMGSERGVIDILANVAMQRERAIVRGEKNRVSQALYGLSLAAPNPDFWIPINPDSGKDPQAVIAELVAMGVNPVDAANIANEPKQQYIDPRTGMVAERVNPQLRSRPDVLAVRVDGKDRYVMFSSDERAQQMVRNLKNLDAEQLGVVMQNAAVVTRWFASINTQFNPVFGLTNGVRDLGTASLNLSSTELKNDRAAVLAGAFSALRGIYSDLRDHRAGRTPTSKWALIFEDFAQEGGQTGYRDMFQTSAARTEALASELKNAGKGQRWLAWGEKHSHIFGWLSDYNTSIENAVRVSAYKVALDKGMSKQQAASLAKNLTVNFNKKGLAATQAGAMYAFFNAAVQGSARIGQTMIRIENGKPSLTSAGKTILYGGMMAGVMQALMFSLAGYDDDEPPQFAREKNFIIPLPDGKYISIPYPLGFHVIPGIGRIGAEFALSGFKKPGKRMTDMASMIMDGFNPIGGTSGSLTQMLSPTVVDPIVALNENKDWTGKSIFKEDFNKMHPTAGWTRTKDTASDFSKTIAYAVNYVTGGGKYEIGMLSPTPDQIDYLIGQATGGVGREALKAYQFAKTETSGEDMPMYKVPVAGRFIGETTGQASETSRFYENLKRIGEHKSALDEMRPAKDMPAMVEYMREHPDARMVKIADRASSEIGDLKKIKRDALKRDANAGQIRLIEARIGNRVTAWNALLKEKQDQ